MRRYVVPAVLLALAVTPAWGRPVTIFVGEPHTPSVLYGPADMLCDLNTCRLFSLPRALDLPVGTIVEFGLPRLSGQDRLDIRRCLQLCRASVLGYETKPTPPARPQTNTVTITPIEMRLD